MAGPSALSPCPSLPLSEAFSYTAVPGLGTFGSLNQVGEVGYSTDCARGWRWRDKGDMDTGIKDCKGPELPAKYSQLDYKEERAQAPPSSRAPPLPDLRDQYPHFNNNNVFFCCLVYVFENSHFLYPGFLKPHYIVLFLMESPLKRPLFLSSPVVHLSASQNEFLLSYFFFQSRGKY